MERLVLYNKKGMTLIEIMIALLLLAIVALATMQTALVGMRANLQNAVRDEGVNVTDLRMNELRDTPIDAIPIGTVVEPVIQRPFRGGVVVNYTPVRSASWVDTKQQTKQITMSVAWLFSGQTYTHSVTTIMRRQ
jgi:prepilin-type N-terminal cleavage/methylation domain-containing protein